MHAEAGLVLEVLVVVAPLHVVSTQRMQCSAVAGPWYRDKLLLKLNPSQIGPFSPKKVVVVVLV